MSPIESARLRSAQARDAYDREVKSLRKAKGREAIIQATRACDAALTIWREAGVELARQLSAMHDGKDAF